jgi:hypothetical protein
MKGEGFGQGRHLIIANNKDPALKSSIIFCLRIFYSLFIH